MIIKKFYWTQIHPDEIEKENAFHRAGTDYQDFKLRKNIICVYLRKSVSYIIGGNERFEKYEGEEINAG